MHSTLRAQHLVAPGGVVHGGGLVIAGERIVAVLAPDAVGPDAEQVDGWLVPGFVDTHCHGGGGADFTDPDPKRVAAAVGLHRQHGTTTLFASTVSGTEEHLVEQLRRLSPLVRDGLFAGIHLEGPCLAAARRGAHASDVLRDPDPDLLTRLLDAGGGAVRMVTLAPERPGGLDAVALLRRRGVMPALGHTDADADTTRTAITAGVGVATHLFNAMPAIHHREPGPVPVLLGDQRVMCELIADGTHLAPEIVRMAIAAAGPERIGLVTDAMSAAGCGDGDYRLGAVVVRVDAGVARVRASDGGRGAIAGSTLTMDRAFEFVVREAGASIRAAACMAATVPARTHGLDQVGTFARGRYADACVVDDHGALQRVMRRGEWLSSSSAPTPP